MKNVAVRKFCSTFLLDSPIRLNNTRFSKSFIPTTPNDENCRSLPETAILTTNLENFRQESDIGPTRVMVLQNCTQ